MEFLNPVGVAGAGSEDFIYVKSVYFQGCWCIYIRIYVCRWKVITSWRKKEEKLVLDQGQINYIFQKPMQIVYSKYQWRNAMEVMLVWTALFFFPVFFHFCVGRVLNQESGKNRKEKVNFSVKINYITENGKIQTRKVSKRMRILEQAGHKEASFVADVLHLSG